MDKELNRKMMDWIAGDSVGVSSQTLWAVIMGLDMPSPAVPYDRDDFARCHNLLELCDEETRHKTIHVAAERYLTWKPLEKNWDMLTKLYKNGNVEELNEFLQATK